jgi:hypothetical protein
MLQESFNDLSHSNSPLHWILESKIRQDQTANVLAENTMQSWRCLRMDFSVAHDLAGMITLKSFVGDGRQGDVAAEAVQFLRLISAPAHPRVQAKAVRADMQLRGGRPGSARQALQAQVMN